ncbi:P-loop containing nucleoside triphosphate hydrolase protein [Dactylonectria estremocensis]|uniref:P-loop containing nucleoside triphosphate hydrolase protein n=1 Tax=Dactylonectria estremocensis TaxID=1079267 RepID=A0A9P9JF16_9HYPO|nr:P-loop containing nucleoside triphosphate hydrolase protein [Dactylonectria estremocensis]
MRSQLAKYIPAGSISIRKDESSLPPEFWQLEELQSWRLLSSPGDPQSDQDIESQSLRPDLRDLLLNSPLICPYARLFRALWMKLAFRVHHEDPDRGTIRVYLLPDDVDRSIVDRLEGSLWRLRQLLLSCLDYSVESWNGDLKLPHLNSPRLVGDVKQDDNTEMSLLELFNNIPSPKPDPEAVLEPHSQNSMYALLDSKVPGLKSKLYGYQRRSAALMLQKEISPGNVLDPRLLHVRDQQGSTWYLDSAAGTVLKEPRFYDGVSGGILAEEMGSGKTIICLSLILATRDLPTQPPEHYRAGEVPTRKRIASLADMAASCATRNAVPWKPYFDLFREQLGEEFSHCIETLERNPGHYFIPAPMPSRGRRRDRPVPPPEKMYLSSGSIVVVPNNLLAQWKQEIHKHTDGLEVLVVTKSGIDLSCEALLKYDLILFSQTVFERLVMQDGGIRQSALLHIHFKRCIVDEGHKLGNSRISNRSNLLIALESLTFSSRWIVTGTPSHGLFGVDTDATNTTPQDKLSSPNNPKINDDSSESMIAMEKKDLERIGSIAALYLKVRPWANTIMDVGDTRADWSTYLLLPKHNSKSHGRWDCLRSTVNSLIIRHKLDEVKDLLPSVDEKVVVLEGSHQDQLSLNLFSMMIIFNTVQSQRTDVDYFFHPKQRRNLLQIVHNLKQASFFGGSFFTSEEISKAVKTAEDFLRDKKVPISVEDQQLLEQAIEIGHVAMADRLRNLSNKFHEMLVSVDGFPDYFAQSWSLDGESTNVMYSSTSMLLALQKLIHKSAKQPEELNSLLNGKLIQEGIAERERILVSQSNDKPPPSGDTASQTLAGNTKLGDDSRRKIRSHGVNGVKSIEEMPSNTSLGPLEPTTINSTASSKLSYLIDSVVKHQDDEKIIIFYENENTAWYLASMLDVLQIRHLIYAKGLTTERRAQYVNTFHQNDDFRVLLMDISQAAFGLDMRAASRIYFINPVLNPQIEAQAIGRVRRISQQKPVSVETLVLKNSIEEVILERKMHMSQAEHRRVKSILDIRPIYDWIKGAKIIPLPEDKSDEMSQMTALHAPQFVFGRGFGRTMHPDDGIILDDSGETKKRVVEPAESRQSMVLKRAHDVGPGDEGQLPVRTNGSSVNNQDLAARPARRVRFTPGPEE